MDNGGEAGYPVLKISTLYGFDSNEPMVEISVDPPRIQMDTAQAMAVALRLLQAIREAESDGFLIEFMRSEGFTEQAMAVLVHKFRQWREARVGGQDVTATLLNVPTGVREEEEHGE